MGTKAQMQAYLDAQNGHVGGAKYWDYVYGWNGGGLPFCAVGVSASLKATDTRCVYFPSKVAFDRRDKSIIGSRWVNRDNLEYLDVIAFDWDSDGSGDHVGFFIQYLGGGMCRTFEFNVSNSCGYRTRYVSNIIGGIRPQYTQEKQDKLYVDGVFGPHTVRVLQTRLKAAGCYSGLVDGDFGYYSKLALQRYLRGKGYYTTAYYLDGDFGYYSVLALQKYLRKLGEYGTEWLLDGSWGQATTKALQRALNRGVF